MFDFDTLPDPFEVYAKQQACDILYDAIEKFNRSSPRDQTRERIILIMRYGLKYNIDFTLEQCGELFGITGERVLQIHKKSLRDLKEYLLGIYGHSSNLL